MKTEVKLSVRNLVEYVYRSGSIESNRNPSTAMAEGTRIHQVIQKTYDKKDKKEVYMKAKISSGEIDFIIDGRCDGLFLRGNTVTIDEIKSTSSKMEDITENSNPVHWAQAKCYAYMYAVEHEKQSINVQLTYVQVKTNEIRKFLRTYTFEQLNEFMDDVVTSYRPFAELIVQHEIKRNESMKKLPFPFETYREGQRKFAGAVYKTILDEKQLFANAPTGIGKTISTLFPALKAIGEGHITKVFYLTARTITRTVAEEALLLMKENDLTVHAVTLTAKEKACIKEETICQSEHCEFADGYFDRINEAILDILENESIMDRDTIEAYARKHRVCPFEYSIDLAYIVDVVICDYNYIFDPRVSLKRQYEEQKKRTAILVDEAHQLVDRGREMYSAELQLSLFLEIRKHFRKVDDEIYDSASEIVKYLNTVKSEAGVKTEFVIKELQEELISLLDSFSFFVEQRGFSATGEAEQLLIEGYFASQGMLRLAPLYDERYVTYIEITDHELHMKFLCLDPSFLLQRIGKGFRAKVFFSATFMPFHFYQEMLGSQEGDYALAIDSPFKKEQASIVISPLSTRFKDREKTKEDVVQLIINISERESGNFLVFFPSYKYLMSVYDYFQKVNPEVTTIVQELGMTEQERENFLAAFSANSTKQVIGFAVLGGIFSEGIDLKGDRLNGVIVIGVGLPQLSFERNIMKDYFSSIGKNGYDFAYVYPGMNKVLQAGGRLIRTENDVGTIVLVDDRYLNNKYVQMFPEQWQNYHVFKQ